MLAYNQDNSEMRTEAVDDDDGEDDVHGNGLLMMKLPEVSLAAPCIASSLLPNT